MMFRCCDSPFDPRIVACDVTRVTMTSIYIAIALVSGVMSSGVDDGDSSYQREICTCQNGGQCIADSNNRTICRCPTAWTGDECQFVHIEPQLNAAHELRVMRSHVFATVFVCALVAIVTLVSLCVLIRYMRKKRIYADRWIKASADELYRRPFNGRSSIVVSVSRMNSIRRAAANNGTCKDEEPANVAATGDDRVDDSCSKALLEDSPSVADHEAEEQVTATDVASETVCQA